MCNVTAFRVGLSSLVRGEKQQQKLWQTYSERTQETPFLLPSHLVQSPGFSPHSPSSGSFHTSLSCSDKRTLLGLSGLKWRDQGSVWGANGSKNEARSGVEPRARLGLQ